MKPQIELYYGFEETEDGIFHSFVAADPDMSVDRRTVRDRLADMLDTTPDDDSFDWDSVYINLPDSVVDKIKAEGVKEYIANGGAV